MKKSLLKYITLIEILFLAAWSDMKNKKVSNFLILLGIGFGFTFEVHENKLIGVWYFIRNISYPIIILYLLFLMHALGAGDIKLFSVISSFMGIKAVTICILISIFIGGFLSLIKIVKFRKEYKLWEFYYYLKDLLILKKIKPYDLTRNSQNTICFTIPIFLSCLIYLWEVVF